MRRLGLAGARDVVELAFDGQQRGVNDVLRLHALQAAVGPAIGPCCYEVGVEVSEPFAATFGADVVRGRKLDLWSAAERALYAAGVDDVLRTDVCTCCNPERFFSHRRTGKPRGVQGVIARVA